MEHREFVNFETILRENINNKTSSLYGDVKFSVNRISRPQDVIRIVSSQMKAIQKADQTNTKKFDKQRKTNFLTQEKIDVYDKVRQKKKPVKFETQCLSDTQLIDMVNVAEAFNADQVIEDLEATITVSDLEKISKEITIDEENRGNDLRMATEGRNEVINKADDENDGIENTLIGFTEEFPVFCEDNTQDRKDSCIVKNKEMDDNENISGVETLVGYTEDFVGSDKDIFEDEYEGIDDFEVLERDRCMSSSPILNKIEPIKTMSKGKSLRERDKERSVSPVLMIKNTKKSKSPSPLVFNLESFERFEQVAIPLVEENLDLEMTKHLINSQILDKELFLPSKATKDIANIEQFKHSESNVGDYGKDEKSSITDEVKAKDDKDKHSSTLEDEILFSSDEEDYEHKEIQDLPFTCALETSFYDQPDVLDKTMYVGFQTASNKTIQVCTESFTKAKSLLNEIDSTCKKELTLTELVNICDSVPKSEKCDWKLVCVDNKKKDESLGIPDLSESMLDKLIGVPSQEVTNQSVEIFNNKNGILEENTQFPDIDITNFNTEINEISQNANSKDTGQINENVPMPIQNIEPIKNNKFEGFKTGNNKIIKLSEAALIRCQRVFQDIDLEEKYDQNNQNRISNDTTEPENQIDNKTVETHSNIKEDLLTDINDEIILQEFENIEMCVRNDIKEATPYTGFQTASRKNINISEKATERAKRLFEDIAMDLSASDNLDPILAPKSLTKDHSKPLGLKVEKPITNVGFKTASNRDIKISAEAMAKTKGLFHDIDMDPINTEVQNETSNLNFEDFAKPSTSKGFTGFQTASNKYIAISDEAVLKTKNIFKDIDNTIDESTSKTQMQGNKITGNKQVKISDPDIPVNKNMPDDIHKMNARKMPTPIGFQTANNKRVHISAKALERSRKIFQDEILEPKGPIHLRPESSQLLNKTGSETASHKPGIISTKALQPNRKSFQEDSDSELQSTIFKNSNPAQYLGVQTANNKAVQISASALEKSRKIFQEIPESNTGSCMKTSKSRLSPISADIKAVHIPKKALERTKKIFQNLDSRENDNKLDTELQKPAISFNRVYKEVKISDQVAKSKKFDDDINEMNTEKAIENFCPIQPFTGFQTASNKHVKVSKEALEKCKNIFQDIDFSNDFNDQNINSHTDNFEGKGSKKEVLCGFKTGNNTIMTVSAKSMVRSKRLFDDIDDIHIDNAKNENTKTTKEMYPVISADCKQDNDFIPNKDIRVGSFGFKTASNKKVDISDEALAKTKQIFQDIDIATNDKPILNTVEVDIENPAKRFKPNSVATTVNKENLADIINTQVINNFEDTLYTEDFHSETPRNKRSGSPILSCPRAKKRKFETPYRTDRREINLPINTTEKSNESTLFTENYKKNQIYKLKDLKLDKNVMDPYLNSFEFDTLLNFEFEGSRNDISERKIDMETLKDMFLGSVNQKIVPNGWLENHIKLILWKLISYEGFSELNGVCTAKNLLNQLKYRYDKELYSAERPILRKILEKDDVACRTMVLCVVGVYVDGVKVNSVGTTDNIELLLTDGWYCVMACIDKMLTRLVREEKIVVGSKIVTNGAELLNCEQGVSPWEDTSSVRLKIFGNSTRRARWFSRLGVTRGAILSQLSSVTQDGGKVAKLRLYVSRVYPALYVERFTDGSTVTRSERLEHIYQAKYETDRQNVLEKLYEEVEKEFSALNSQDCDNSWDNLKTSLQSGSQMFEAMRSKDPNDFKNHLTTSQAKLLERQSNKRREQYIEKVQARLTEKIDGSGLTGRNVVTVLKVRVIGVDENTGAVSKGLLSVWKPNDSIIDLVKEDKWIEVMNVVPTAFRYSEIQLSAGRQSIFIQSKYKETDKVKQLLNTFRRSCCRIDELKNTTEYNEVDTAGLIFLIEPSLQNFDSKSQFQNIYLTDKEMNMICVNFWGGLQKFGFQNILDTGQVVACVNLQKRAGNTRNIPQYRATEFSYFTKTPKSLQAKEIVDQLNNIPVLDRRRICEECVKLKNSFTVKSNESVTPYRSSDLSKKLESVEKIHAEFNLTGLDFESSFRQQELSPKALKRKQEVNKRINKLKMYGEPPPLASIHIINKSKNASSSYKSPMNDNSSVASDNIGRNVGKINPVLSRHDTIACGSGRNVENRDSPVTSLNKTYVKSAVNPLKLNFDNSEVDHFAEEFESSPPLSLD